MPLAPVSQVISGDFTNVPIADTPLSQSCVAKYADRLVAKHLMYVRFGQFENIIL